MYIVILPFCIIIFNPIYSLKRMIIRKYGLKIGDIYLSTCISYLPTKYVENLQAQIELFYKYCEIWNLIIIIAKTKIVIYNQIYAKH